MSVVLNSEEVQQVLSKMSEQIRVSASEGENIAFIGIRSRGEILAERLSEMLSELLGIEVPCGTLDITLYRDDLNSPSGDWQPVVRTTEIGFNIDEKLIILVDDVLHTGRSTRAALDALIDLGRPKSIRLAVLVDRQGREFPIQADYFGVKSDVEPGKSVKVNLVESDGKDEVVIE